MTRFLAGPYLRSASESGQRRVSVPETPRFVLILRAKLQARAGSQAQISAVITQHRDSARAAVRCRAGPGFDKV